MIAVMPLNAERDQPMAIPDFQSVMLPLVKALGDGQERTMREVTDLLAESFQLTDKEREELLPSGQQSLFSNRVAWAKSHLRQGEKTTLTNWYW
jgi:restriction system protein